MQGSTKTIGGGSAVPTANAFNDFLKNILEGAGGSGNKFSGAIDTLLGGGPAIDNTRGMANLPNAPGDGQYKNLNDNLSFNPDVTSARAMNIKNILDRQNNLDVANTRARFSGGGGMGSIGSGASLAEAQTRANGQDRLLAGLQGITQEDINNTLNFGQANNAATQMMNQNLFNANQNQLQNQYLGNQFGLDSARSKSQNMMGILSQLFGSLNNTNQLGTPQAQTAQTPSPFSQIMGAAGTLAPYIAAPFTGGASLGLAGLGEKGGAGIGDLASMFAPNSMRFGVPSSVSGFGGVPPVPMF